MKKLLLTAALVMLATPAFAKEYTIKEISDPAGNKPYYFEPNKLTIQPGDTVTFVNAQEDMHNVMFNNVPNKDCAKIDLQHADNAPLLKKSDIVKVFFPVLQVQDLNNTFSPASLTIRGLPTERLSASETHPPILLSFGRLRI